MRRIAAALAAGAAIAALAAPSAHAAPAVVQAGVGGADVFSPPPYDHEAGTVATLQWVGGGSHNATATSMGPDVKPVFRSATISGGSAPIRGSQYLPVGAYPFVCTVHPGMASTLDITSGTPRPQPTVRVKVTSTKLAKVLAKGKVGAKVTLTGDEPAEVAVRLGKRVLGSATTPRSGPLSIRLSKKGAKALGARRKAPINLQASVDFGQPTQTKAVLK